MKIARSPSFTFMEIVVVMLISAIVVAITYTVYLIVSKSYQSFDRKHQDMAVMLKLDELLKKDFNRSVAVYRDTNRVTFQFMDYDIHYTFDTAFVVRAGAKADTFKVRTDSVRMTFENNIIESASADHEQNKIDQLDMSLILEKEKITYHYQKLYSSSDLIHRKSNAIN